MRSIGMIVAILLAFLSTASVSWAVCPGGASLGAFAGKSVILADDTLFFRTPTLALDHDGSPEAYGVRDQGFEFICNGLAPRRPANCAADSNRGQVCGNACRSTFAAWSRAGADLLTLGQTMCSIGLGGGGCSDPKPRFQEAPRQDWFVSESSVKVARPAGEPPGGWTLRQAAQLDPAAIRYFVVPGGFRRMPWDATPGDAGFILDAASGRGSYFIIGDHGGRLDEASTALHTALRGGSPPPMADRTSALGEPVRRYVGGTNGDFRVAIFRHSSTRQPNSMTLALKADQVEAWAKGKAAERLAAIGGEARLRACAER